MKLRIVFSSCSIFQPVNEASGYVVQAYAKDIGCWIYLMRPLKESGHGWFSWDQGMATAKKVALAGEVDASRWSTDYPQSDFELIEWKPTPPDCPE